MNFLPCRFASLLLCSFALVQARAADFSLLPKSMQSNPKIAINVITEMTDEGRKAPQPDPNKPLYYITQPAGYVQLGHGTAAGEKPPAVEEMQKTMERSLVQNGYRISDKDHPASILIVFVWGSHSSPGVEGMADGSAPASSIPNEVLINDMIARARLVGGDKFANAMVKAMAEEGAAKKAMYKGMEDKTATGNGDAAGGFAMPNIMGDGSGAMTAVFSPMRRFRERNDKNNTLMEDVTGSIFFVIASAYDYASATTDSKILLWRTKMSVNAHGVSLTESVPALVTAASNFFGRDMPEVEILTQRVTPEGTTRLGPLEVKGYYDKLPPPPGDDKPAAEKKP